MATSDIHGKMLPYDYGMDEESESGSLAQVSSAIKEFRTENTIVVDAGDLIQGNFMEIFTQDEIHPMVQAINLIGYDAWTAGNHEFNYGVQTLMDIKNQFNNTFLCGNVYDTEGETVGDGYTIIEKSGVKVAVIGMVTPLITEWDKDNMMDYTVTDPVEETRKIIDEINGKVDVIVAVEHMGENNEYNVKNTGARDLADACPEIDVIVAAHEHKQIPGTEENGVLIVENENGGQSLARVNLVLEKDGDGEYQIEGRTSESIEISDYEPDEMINSGQIQIDTLEDELHDYEPNSVTVREEDILK